MKRVLAVHLWWVVCVGSRLTHLSRAKRVETRRGSGGAAQQQLAALPRCDKDIGLFYGSSRRWEGSCLQPFFLAVRGRGECRWAEEDIGEHPGLLGPWPGRCEVPCTAAQRTRRSSNITYRGQGRHSWAPPCPRPPPSLAHPNTLEKIGERTVFQRPTGFPPTTLPWRRGGEEERTASPLSPFESFQPLALHNKGRKTSLGIRGCHLQLDFTEFFNIRKRLRKL